MIFLVYLSRIQNIIQNTGYIGQVSKIQVILDRYPKYNTKYRLYWTGIQNIIQNIIQNTDSIDFFKKLDILEPQIVHAILLGQNRKSRDINTIT